MTILNIMMVVYIISLVLSYILLRRNYIRTGSMPFAFIVMGMIPFLNIVLFIVMLWIEIEETISYNRFLQFIFFKKKG